LKKLFVNLFILVASVFLLLLLGKKISSVVFPEKKAFKILVAEGEISKGDSLYTCLRKLFSVQESVLAGKALSSVYDTRRVRAGDKYKIYYSTAGAIYKLLYKPSPLLNYVVERSSAGFTANEVVPEVQEKIAAVKGTIRSSLYESMVNCGMDVTSIMNFADIFQWQIDFFTEVYPGDKFLVVFKQYYLDGKPVENGSIIVASYKGKRGNFTAIRYKDGKYPDYYDADGDSFRKQFLRAPLSFTRISSYFTYKRRHPILKYVRPHLGIDYAAPIGTPVSSIGSGRVVFAGWKGGYGRTVEIRHNSVYTTQYGHLRSYGRGIKKGVYVKQGQVVGYVGTSGLSTGPHLDFRIEKYGKPVNFLTLKFPPAKSVSRGSMKNFLKEVEKARIYLKYLQSDFFAGKPALIEDFLNTEEYVSAYQTKLQRKN